MGFSKTAWAAIALTLLGWMAACSSGSDSGPCLDGQACGVRGTCIGGVCVEPDAVGYDLLPIDAGVDTAITDTGVTDAANPDSGPDTTGWDLEGPDIQPPDRTPPRVVSMTPADGSTNVSSEFVIRIEFSEAMRPTTLTPQTVQVTDVGNNAVAGVISLEPDAEDPTTVVFTPSQAILPGSPYAVEISTAVQDQAGNRMETFFRGRFYTEPHGGLAGYQSLAADYAPYINQETSQDEAKLHYLSSFDLDGDWDFTNNVTAIRGATSVAATVYYTVVESKSHYFITYLYFHPLRDLDNASDEIANDLAGAQVVVAKYPSEHPILVQVYSKVGTAEDILAYATSESGLDAPQSFHLDGAWSQAELFPNGHYTAYLSQPRHESCVFLDQDNNIPSPCVLPAAQVSSKTFIQYVYKGGAAEPIEKDGNTWPIDSGDNPYGYALVDLLPVLWPRRMEVAPSGLIFDNSYIFESNTGRPGNGTPLGSRFLNPLDDSNEYARPPWAWGWRPSFGSNIDMARGTFFMDPAYFVNRRFSVLADWNPDTNAGFALDYCFNPYLNLDHRSLDTDHCSSPSPE